MNFHKNTAFKNYSSPSALSGLKQMKDIMDPILTSVSVMVIIVGFLGNMAAITVFCKRWSSLKSHEVFVVVLVMIDFLLSFLEPMFALVQRGVIIVSFQNDLCCQWISWFLMTLNVQSAWIMVAIAIDRFIMIVVKSYSFMRSTNKKKTLIISCVLFLFASPIGALYFYRIKSQEIPGRLGRKICVLSYLSKEEDLFHTTSAFAVQMVGPGFILTVMYTWMIIRLRKPVKFQENIREIELRKRRHWKIVRLFLTILAIFYIIALPYPMLYMVHTIQLYKGNIIWARRNRELIEYTFRSFKLLSYLNYSIDPFIYAGFYFTDIIGKIRNTLYRRRSKRSELRENIQLQTVDAPFLPESRKPDI